MSWNPLRSVDAWGAAGKLEFLPLSRNCFFSLESWLERSLVLGCLSYRREWRSGHRVLIRTVCLRLQDRFRKQSGFPSSVAFCYSAKVAVSSVSWCWPKGTWALGTRLYKPIWRQIFMAHALETFYCRAALGNRVNPDTIGCVWTGEFDLNTLLVDGEFLNPERKSCRFKNIRILMDGA